ncbi:hypothetical protein GCM10009119_04290 [Algoriphagus jejuensis]|uniref:Membrane protein DUF2306 n=1 Tax=Algoriphagus jejuensis TaxID=419934 RepID=A0ABP3YA98_9BACT
MNSNPQVLLSRPKSKLVPILWILVILFAGRFIVKDALPYYGMDEEVFGRFWNWKWPLIGHVSGGLIALLIGPFQFSTTFREKHLHIHRWMGRTYLVAILIATISSSYLAWTTALAIHWSWALSLQGLAFAWIVTAGMAFISIKRGHRQQHKEWMIRSYVVTFAFVTFRFINEMESVRALGNFIERGPTEIWVSWAIPLLAAEVVMSLNRKN